MTEPSTRKTRPALLDTYLLSNVADFCASHIGEWDVSKVSRLALGYVWEKGIPLSPGIYRNAAKPKSKTFRVSKKYNEIIDQLMSKYDMSCAAVVRVSLYLYLEAWRKEEEERKKQK